MRKDGRLIKTVDPFAKVAMNIMAERNDAVNLIKLEIKHEPISQYINEKRNLKISISHLGVIIAAYVRTLAEHPELNRFIVNRRLYARNDISIGMVVLKPGETEETMNKMYFKPEMTIFEIQKIIDEYISENREKGDTNATDKMINFLLSVPGLCRIAVSLFKFMDKLGLLTRGLIATSPFHCTMTVTNLASIGTNYIYHHIYKFGTTSMIMSIGNLCEVPIKRHGQVEFERCIPLGFSMDERIISGYEYARAFKTMQRYLKNPRLLENPPEKVNEDIR